MMIIVVVGSRHSIHLWIAQCYQTHHSPRWLKTATKIAAAAAPHCGSECRKPAKTWLRLRWFHEIFHASSENFHNFHFRLPALHIQSLSNRCRHKYGSSFSRDFPCKFLQILNFRFRLSALQIQNLSNHCRHKYDLSISRFFIVSFLAGFYNLAQLCGPAAPRRQLGSAT